jgi:translation elongation factor aEF-1 beta
MTGIAGIKIKLMPISPDVDLKEIEDKTREIVENEGGVNKEYQIEPIAFGLKAIIAFFQWPEEKEIEYLEEKLRSIENVQSVQTIDMRKIA